MTCSSPIRIIIFCAFIATGFALSNREVRRRCERKAKDAFGSSRDKCTAFKRCCAEQCREDGRSVVSDTCEGRFFDTAEKDCICGRPQSGGRSSSRHASEGDLTDICTREGDEEMGSVNSKCQKFKRCCLTRCRDRGMNVEAEKCEGYMYSLAEKECRCGSRRRGGSTREDRYDRGSSSDREEWGNRGSSRRRGSTDTSRIEQDCVREGDNIDGSISEKCRAFRKCCSRECRESGSRDRVNKCDGFIYLTAQKSCQCSGSDGGMRHRPDSTRSQDRSSKCREKARLSPHDDTVKCRSFKTCCIDTCLRAGGVTDENKCRPGYLRDAECTCDVASGGGGRDDGSDRGGSRRGSHGHGGSRGGGGRLDETRTCNRAYENAFGSKSTKCTAFRRCCTDECRGHGMGVMKEMCDPERGRSPSRQCVCGGSGSSSRRENAQKEISRRCRRHVERNSFRSREKCDGFRSCCRKECVDMDMSLRNSRCHRNSFDRALCECEVV